jgi:essential recombination function protein|nr:MAG TPA: ERF superfamily protein [Caudoviricetes sp.]
MTELKLHERLLNVQHKLKAPKGQYNKFGNFNYRSAEDILEAVKPLNFENGLTLTISDEIKEVAGRIYVLAVATVTDGTDSISAQALAREPENRKGMDESQITGATSSYARKYALNGLYAIDDNKDSDNENNNKNEQNKEDDGSKELILLVSKYLEKLESMGVERKVVVDYICETYKVKQILEVAPNKLIGELKKIYFKKKSDIEKQQEEQSNTQTNGVDDEW